MPILYNPTPKPIPAVHGGMSTTFAPGMKKEIFDGYAAKHMVNRWGKNGLVALNFGDKEAAKYSSYDEYVHAQGMLGLAAYVAHLEERVRNFDYYLNETKDKSSPERNSFLSQRESAQRELDEGRAFAADFARRDPMALSPDGADAIRKQIASLQHRLQEAEVTSGDDQSESA